MNEIWLFCRICILVSLLTMVRSNASAQSSEICDNAVDDDGDGLIDLQDSDCICEFIEFRSLVPNPSFEELLCCPDSSNQLNCTADWIRALDQSGDYIHQCGYIGPGERLPPIPFPDGEGAFGFIDGQVSFDMGTFPGLKGYAAVCLTEPMQAGITYRMDFFLGFVNSSFSIPIEVSLFGTDDCSNFPFVRDQMAPGCPANSPNWELIESDVIEGAPEGSWEPVTFLFTPEEDISMIALGPDCEGEDLFLNTYYFIDLINLEKEELFVYNISSQGNPCGDNHMLSSALDIGGDYQWYKDSIAIVGETEFSINTTPYGPGNYQIVQTSQDSCFLSNVYKYVIPSFTDSTDIELCIGEVFQVGSTNIEGAGTYVVPLTSNQGCDSIVTFFVTDLDLIEIDRAISIFDGGRYDDGDFSASEAGSYNYIKDGFQTCDTAISLELAHYKIYVPNAFSPNGDQINDLFTVSGDDSIIEINQSIYDRWGNSVYSGPEWDGMIDAANALAGVYIYEIELRSDTNRMTRLVGTVQVIY